MEALLKISVFAFLREVTALFFGGKSANFAVNIENGFTEGVSVDVVVAGHGPDVFFVASERGAELLEPLGGDVVLGFKAAESDVSGYEDAFGRPGFLMDPSGVFFELIPEV